MSGQLFFGLVLGLIGAVAIYHVLMFAVLRAHEFLAYGAYLVALAAFEVARTHLVVPQNSWFSWLSFAALRALDLSTAVEPWEGVDRAAK